MSKKIKVDCKFCKKLFYKEARFYNRSEKMGSNHFCSRSCASIFNQTDNPKSKYINLKYGSKPDDFSPFRKYYSSLICRCKRKGIENNIKLIDLKNLWDNQEGRCSLSGIKMIIHPTTCSVNNTKVPNLASLDRIDSNRGYIVDNIQWICLIANYAKNTFSKEDLITFCKQTADFNHKVL